MHAVAVEDIVHIPQRIKAEYYPVSHRELQHSVAAHVVHQSDVQHVHCARQMMLCVAARAHALAHCARHRIHACELVNAPTHSSPCAYTRLHAHELQEYLYASVLLLAVGHPSELQEEEDEQLQQQAGPPNGDGQAGSSILRRRLSSSGGSRSGAGASARRGGSFKRRQAPPAHLQPMDLSVDQASLFL